MTLRRSSRVLLAIGVGACIASTATAAARVARWRGPEHRAEVIDHVSACLSPHPGPRTYGWPIKPFDEPHPVRGNFGDPRTDFLGGLQGGPTALGGFRFHNGVDISAPDGTSVYAVVSGHVVYVAPDHVAVRTADHRHFQYWHIRPAVHAGEAVIADKTVLGHILPREGHVHLTEIDRFRVANPLLPGHLFPYRDEKPPRIDSLRFLDAGGHELSGPTLDGTVTVTATAHDEPSLLPPGRWRNAVVTPAVIGWWLAERDGSLLGERQTVFDVRHTLPLPRAFWRVYAPGTFQNFPVSDRRHLDVTGSYIFRITELDTRRLPDGEYTLTVQASDVCGNSGSLTAAFRINK